MAELSFKDAYAQAKRELAEDPDYKRAREETQDTRSSGSKAYEAVARPVTGAVSEWLHTLSRFDPINLVPGAGALTRPTREDTTSLAEAVVPQTPMQAGLMAGTMAAGGLPVALLKAYPALARLLGGTAGGAVGGGVEEGAAGAAKGAGIGALSTLPERLVAVGGKVLRSIPGAKGRIAGQDAARLGETMGEISAPLKGAKTAEELRAMAAGPGRERLGQAKEGVVGVIENLTGGRPISVPSLGDTPMSIRDANLKLSEIGARAFSKNPLDRNVLGIDQRQLYGEVSDQIRAGIAQAERGYRQGLAQAREEFGERATRRALPPAGGSTVVGPPTRYEARPLSSREGVERTLESSQASSVGTPYREGARHVSTAQPPYVSNRMAAAPAAPASEGGTARVLESSPAAALWERGQERYKEGLALLRLIEDPAAYRHYSNQVQLNTPALQRAIARPKGEAQLRSKLGGEAEVADLGDVELGDMSRSSFDQLAAALTRGGRVGHVDELAWGRGDMGDALRMILEMRGGTAALVGATPKTLLPNLSSRYAGRAPYAAPGSIRALIDLVAQRGASEFER